MLVTTFKILQLLEDFVPRPHNWAPPLDPAGGPVPQTPCGFAPSPSQTSFRRLWLPVGGVTARPRVGGQPMCVTRGLFNGNNLATSAALAEVCALLNVV